MAVTYFHVGLMVNGEEWHFRLGAKSLMGVSERGKLYTKKSAAALTKKIRRDMESWAAMYEDLHKRIFATKLK